MELFFLAFSILPFIGAYAWNAQNKARKQRIEDAYKFESPNIYGIRKIATDEEMKKAGLL